MKFLCLGKKKDSREGGSVELFIYNHIELYLIIKNKLEFNTPRSGSCQMKNLDSIPGAEEVGFRAEEVSSALSPEPAFFSPSS